MDEEDCGIGAGAGDVGGVLRESRFMAGGRATPSKAFETTWRKGVLCGCHLGGKDFDKGREESDEAIYLRDQEW